jgi:uncharacterized protein (TIGR00288 family)
VPTPAPAVPVEPTAPTAPTAPIEAEASAPLAPVPPEPAVSPAPASPSLEAERPAVSHGMEPAETARTWQAAPYEPPYPLSFERAEAHPAPASPYGVQEDEPNEQDELFPFDEDTEDSEDEENEAAAGGELEMGSARGTDAAGDAIAGEAGEAGDAGEKDETGEKRGRRSRRSRGGRRRSGRAAAPANGAAAEEDDEDPLDEIFDEPVLAPAPVQAAPQVAPIAPRRRERERERERERDRPEERDRDRGDRDRDSFFVSPSELLPREIYVPVAERPRSHNDEKKIALFCDLENIALGVRDSDVAKFDINLVLERLLEKGKIIVKKAYADWERYSDYKRPFHEAAIELIDIPQKYYSGKNSADIKMVVDAMDLSYSKEHLDTFVLLSGDSDFSPLVSKLKENNKYVIGIGVKNSSSNLLVDNCDEFIYYEDVWRDSSKAPQISGLNKKAAEAFMLMVESIQALTRENKDVLWGSMIKQTMQRKKPSFNEGYYGYSTFSELLEDAERKNIIKLKKDQRSGTYIVTGFAKR